MNYVCLPILHKGQCYAELHYHAHMLMVKLKTQYKFIQVTVMYVTLWNSLYPTAKRFSGIKVPLSIGTRSHSFVACLLGTMKKMFTPRCDLIYTSPTVFSGKIKLLQ